LAQTEVGKTTLILCVPGLNIFHPEYVHGVERTRAAKYKKGKLDFVLV